LYIVVDEVVCIVIKVLKKMMADPERHFEAILCRVREQLNKERLQLWLHPFTVEGETQGNYPEVNVK
jgi:hypothetical protein